MSRPRNNLDELQRKHALPSASSPATPQPSGSKAKFKPAKSIPTPSVRKLPSFSTPGWNKVKPPPLKPADNSSSYINVSSTESTPLNASTSSIPFKRLSAGSPDDLIPPSPPKRPKTVHSPDKENIFHVDAGKGKGRAREPPRTSVYATGGGSRTTAAALPPRTYAAPPAAKNDLPARTLRATFDALPHDVGLDQKNEKELRAACDTAQDLIEAVDKLIGAARADPNEPKDVEFLNVLSDYIEKRQTASRAELKAIQRGERSAAAPASTIAASVDTVATGSTTLVDSDLSWDFNPVVPRNPVDDSTTWDAGPVAGPSTIDAAFDADEQLWNSFDDDEPIDLTDLPDDNPSAVPTPATPPATQPRSALLSRAPSPPVEPEVVYEPTTLTQRSYFSKIMDALNKTFKLKSFRPQQFEAICAAMEGRDVFVLFPTGSGKSLTFQIPAVCQDGVTIVISPLRSLMSDQVEGLRKHGVDVAKLTGDMSEAAKREVMQRLSSKDRKKPSLVYVAPEQLQMNAGLCRILEWLNGRGELKRFVVDEAHCISDWGRRFRDSYTQLTDLRKMYPTVPISALTATANAEVERDIIVRLGIQDCVRLKLSFNRKNLDYDVRLKKTAKATLAEIAQFIQGSHQNDTGIIYCHSRNNCEDVAKALRDQYNMRAKHYHASMDSGDRERVQREWSRGEVLVIVATVAFGMGIDKADVRYVIHYSLPSTLANYYQETGRGGRDGNLAKCILYYNWGDVATRLEMIRKEDKNPEEKRWQEDDLMTVYRYCTNDVRCRRQQVLAYFSEKFDKANCKDLCNNCRDKTPTETVDYTKDAANALRLLASLNRNGGALTKHMFVSALRGSKIKQMTEKGYDKDPHYGPCKHLAQNIVERITDEMLFEGLLHSIQVQKGEYNQTYMQVGPKADRLRNGEIKLEIEFRKGNAARQRKPSSRAAPDYDSAGPSHAGPSRVVSSRSRKAKAVVALEEDPAEKLSLYRDAPDDDPDFDDIEEFTSPPPPARRMGTRAAPSASQSLVDDLESDIEEYDAPPNPRVVTLVQSEDLPLAAPASAGVDFEMECQRELDLLREEMSIPARHIAELLTDEAIQLLAVYMPNDAPHLQETLGIVGLGIEHLGEWHKRVLSICARYRRRRGH